MTCTTLDPLQCAVLDILRGGPATTEEIRSALLERGEAPSARRLSAVLHDLRLCGRLAIRRHCDVYRPRLPVRQEWHIVAVDQ